MSGRPKLIYFAERRPEMSREAFRERWREHARLGMSMPRWRNIHRYIHCDVVANPGGHIPAIRCDGVAAIWYKDEAHRLSHIADRAAAPILKRDELETFARPVRHCSLLADESILVPFEGERQKLFLKLRRNPQIGRGEFKTWWLNKLGPQFARLLSETGMARGYAQNHARPVDEAEPEPLCDCIDEIAAADAAPIDEIFAGPLRRILENSGFLRDIEGVWTEETVLHPAP